MNARHHRANRTLPTANRAQSGNALFTAVLMMTVVATGTAAFLGVAVNASEAPRAQGDRFETKRAASSVNKLAARGVWSTYEAALGAGLPSLAGLRTSLTAQGLGPQAPGVDPVRTELLGRLGLTQNGRGNDVLGDVEVLSVMAHRIDLARETQITITTTTRLPRGYDGASTNVIDVVTDVFSLEPARWDGLDFAILANNINCIMCHTTVDDARRVYDGDGLADAGGYGRARVGSIESFQFREDPDSAIAGTLYLGGPAIDDHGERITDWDRLTLLGGDLDGEGRIREDFSGDAMLEALAPADAVSPNTYENLYVDYFDTGAQVDGTLPESFPVPFRDDGGFDRITGDVTPAGGGNRVIDDNEFTATADRFNGSIDGGAIGIVAPGDQVTDSTQAAQLISGTERQLGSVTSGNVVLTGTAIEPIRIDGDVAIDGDLVISGPIEGSGSLWVRGNVYIPSDLQYADATASGERQFGVSDSGQLNALGLTAGGNVVMGNPFRPQWGDAGRVDGTPDAPWNFTLEETAIFNRGEWVKTQPELPGLPEPVQVGTRTVRDEQFQVVNDTVRVPITQSRDTGRTREVPVYDDVVIGSREVPTYTNVQRNDGRPAPYGRTWTERVQTGTRNEPITERQQVGTRQEPIFEDVVIGFRDEPRTRNLPYDPRQFIEREEPIIEMQRPMLPNPNYRGPNFVPRFYAFGEGDPVPVLNKEGYFDPALGLWLSEERVDGWDEDRLTIADPNDPNDPTLYPAGRPAAVIETLEPSDNWLDPKILEELIKDALAARDSNEPFRVDATLYSANSIFGIVPNSTPEGTNGAIRVQGSILAADIGLLGPEGTEVLYDPRSQAVLDIRDENKIELRLLGSVPSPRP